MVQTHKTNGPDKKRARSHASQQKSGYSLKDERDYTGKKFADTNPHNLIDRYTPQEQALLEKVARRQKRFMRKSGDEELRFVSRTESTYSNGISVDHKSEVNDLSNLFKDTD